MIRIQINIRLIFQTHGYSCIYRFSLNYGGNVPTYFTVIYFDLSYSVCLKVGNPFCMPKIRICVNTFVCQKYNNNKKNPLLKFKCLSSPPLQTLALHCVHIMGWNNITIHKWQTCTLCILEIQIFYIPALLKIRVHIYHNAEVAIKILECLPHRLQSS